MSASKKPKGIVCIINNFGTKNLPGNKERRGSEKDVEALVRVFSKFNWKFVGSLEENKLYHSDPDQSKIETVMRKVVEKGNDDEIPIFVFVMAHGKETELSDGKGDFYDPNEIILKHFNYQNAPQLENVLKVLVIQSCRGKLPQPCYDAVGSTGANRNLDGYFKNTIVAHSTMQNYSSVRCPENGTPYIQHFCEAFEQGQSLNIIDFFMDVAD